MKFYHASTTIRKNHNRISGLKDNEGIWTAEPTKLRDMVRNYYIQLFTADESTDYTRAPKGCYPELPGEDWEAMHRPVNNEEIKQALFSMAPGKHQGQMAYRKVISA